MGGFLIFQPRAAEDTRGRLTRAEKWFDREKKLPLVDRIEEREISLLKYGRRFSNAAATAKCADGWLASVGYWNYPHLPGLNDNAGLLDLLLARGPSVLERLDGMYAIAWYRRPERTLGIATDHLGRLHVFYSVTEDGAVVSTSSIAAARLFPSEPDPIAVNEMLATGSIYEDRTPFRNVRRIAAASLYEFRGGALTLSRSKPEALWGPDALAKPEETAEKVAGTLQGSLEILLRGHEKPLSDLTGGLDSRLLLGLMLRLGCKPHLTVTGLPDDPDVRLAKGIADRVGLPIAVEHPSLPDDARRGFEDALAAAALSEGQFDPISYSLIERIHCGHAHQFDVSINGSGGEVLRNYWWNKAHVRGEGLGLISEAVRRFTRETAAPWIVNREFRLELRDHFEAVIARCLDHVKELPDYGKLDHLYLFLRIQCWQGSIASATNQIWPAVSPYLQRRALQAALSLSPRTRLGRKAMNQIIYLCSPTLAAYPLETGFPPMSPTPTNFWRFMPGLARLPLWLCHRLADHRRTASGRDRNAAGVVRSLFANGAAEYFRPEQMILRCCLDEAAFVRFADEARATGNVPLSLVGRLVALESAYRSATGGGRGD